MRNPADFATSPDTPASWGNLPLRQRVVDTLGDAMLSAFDILQMIEAEPAGHDLVDVRQKVQEVYETIKDLMHQLSA